MKQNAINWPFFIIGVALLVAALGFAIWTFLLGTLTEDQRLILLWVLPLASGFGSGSFVGSMVAKGKRLFTGVGVTATGGFAVWLLSHWLLPMPRPPSKPVTIELLHGAEALAENFEITLLIPPYQPQTAIGKGSVTVQLPSHLAGIERIDVKCPGFIQSEFGPFSTAQGLVRIQMLEEPPPPLLISPCSVEEAINGFKEAMNVRDPGELILKGSAVDSKDVVFYFRNKTNKHLVLYLFSGWKYYRSDGGKRLIGDDGSVLPNTTASLWF
jgi:hypothetical protein